ncbi:tetratricopeptide repeat protein [Rhodoluna sp.]|uniref:tetratricopeptide repeat protein n=1 Tax=Rhodoluna sp. TaxID=1969481 RepID=UPI0025DF60CB|nr:tetratricopeptide repeat protein [Rhodoluna sp.]
MADFTSRANLAGAYDLSSLRKPEAPAQPTQAAAPQQNMAEVAVPDLVTVGTEANIKAFLNLSKSVAVVVEFFATWSEPSKVLGEKIEAAVRAKQGQLLLVRVDADSAPTLVQAFQVKSVPSVLTLVKGQSVPLFEGDQSAESVSAVLDRLLEVGKENGITGKVVVSEGAKAPEPELPPLHKAAFDAIDAGDYPAAVEFYKRALAEKPSDQLAVAGLAQANLLVRTSQFDVDAAVASEPSQLQEILNKADACVALGHAQQGFDVILKRFAIADQTEREILRKHLLELFQVWPQDSSEVIAARRALTALLF